MDKVLHLLPALDVGGAERALARLLSGGLATRFENHVVSMRGGGAMEEAYRQAGAQVHLMGRHGKPALPFEIVSLASRLRPAIVQGWMYHANFAATMLEPALRPAATLWNIRQSLDDISGDKFLTRQLIRAGRWLSGRPAKIIYNSGQSARQHEDFGYRKDKTQVIPNGFETDAVRPDPDLGRRYRGQFGIAPAAPLFVHAARYHPMKDHALFIAAASQVLDLVPDARFVMMGRGVDTQAATFLAPLAAASRSSFVILGERDDVPDILQAADALVVSSRRAEGFPNVIGEAMMTATAVLATDTGDCASIVGDGGLIVPPRRADALAQAMVQLAQDRRRSEGLGRNGRRRVESVFTNRQAAASYVALYDNALNGEPDPCVV